MATRQTTDAAAHFAPFDADVRQTPYAFFCTYYVAVLEQLHHALLEKKQASNITFSKVVNASRPRWPNAIASYFSLPPSKREQLRENEGAMRAVGEFIANLTERFCNDTSQVGNDRLGFFAAFLDSLKTHRRLDVALKNFSYKEPAGRKAGEGKEQEDNTELLQVEFRTFREEDPSAERKRDEVAHQLSNVVKYVMEKVPGTYFIKDSPKQFSGVPASSKAFLKSRLYGLSYPGQEQTRNEYGLFSIIRQARGIVNRDPLLAKMIVRDLLWLRPQVDKIGESSKFAGRGAASRLGYFFSTVDSLVYTITSISKRGGILMADLVAYCEEGDTRSGCLYLAASSERLKQNFSLGTLMGTTREAPRTGGWSVIGVRPKLDDQEDAQLDSDLSVYCDHASAQVGKNRYFKTIRALSQYIEATNLRGVIYTRAWETAVPPSEASTLRERLEAFQNVLWFSKERRDFVKSVVNDELRRLGNKESFSRKEVEEILFERLLVEASYAIVPENVTADSIRGQLNKLNTFMEKLLGREMIHCLDLEVYKNKMNLPDKP